MRKASSFSIYHVTNRGICKSDIFRNDSDRSYFEDCLKLVVSVKFKYHGFAQMDNHVHLLVSADSLPTLSHAMMVVFSNYVKYFNKKYDRDGPLFKNRFWSEPIESWSYFKFCLRYILRNPLEIGIKLEDYKWSSLHHYYSNSPTFVETRLVRKFFPDKNALITFLKKEDDIYIGLRPDEYKQTGKIRDDGSGDRKRILLFIRRKYNIYNPLNLATRKKCEIIADILKIMPKIPMQRFSEVLRINPRTIRTYLKNHSSQ